MVAQAGPGAADVVDAVAAHERDDPVGDGGGVALRRALLTASMSVATVVAIARGKLPAVPR